MALPTAQLGQLPTMSMPYSIPTYDVGPNIWEKALSSLLVGAASGASQQGVGNLLSRDYASEFGETPAKGFGRLLGPKVGEGEAKQRRQNAFVSNEASTQRGFDAQQAQFRADEAAMQHEADAKNALLREDSSIQAGLDRQLLDDKNSLLRQDRDVAAAQELMRLRALAEANDPGRKAAASADIARARMSNAEADMYERFAKRGTNANQASAPSNVSPEVAKFARGSAQQESLPDMSGYTPGLSDYLQRLGGGVSPQPQVTAPQETAVPMTQQSVPSSVTLDELLAQATGAKPTPGQMDVGTLAALQELLHRAGVGMFGNDTPHAAGTPIYSPLTQR